jgi:hypothetical protein
MNKTSRFVFPVILGVGVSFYLIIVHALSLGNPTYVHDDRLVSLSFWLTIIGVIGSLVVAIKRFGFSRLKILLSIWILAAISLIMLYTGDDLTSLGWAFIAYPSVILGSIMVIVYSFRNV